MIEKTPPSTQTNIVEVETPELLNEFIKFPLRLYANDPHYVAPLISERKEFFDQKENPFFSGAKVKLFLAKQKGETVGRISTCVYFAHNDLHHETTGFFGFFDTIENEAVAHALLKTALITLKQENMTQMRGPASFCTNHECGFLVEGFDSPPAVMMPYDRPYQAQFAESFGLAKEMDLYAYLITKETFGGERLLRLADKIAQRSGATIRPLNMKRFDEEVALIHNLYNKAWALNWGFVPMTQAEFQHMAKQMKQIIEPELALIAEVDGQAIGFSLSLPDINQALKYLDGTLFPSGLIKLLWHTKVRNKVTGLRTIIMGVLPEYQKKGIDSLFHMRTFKAGSSLGYTHSEISWVLETNSKMRILAERLGAAVYKTYRLVEMDI
ncbi:hypothetical protein JYT16_02270 [Gemmatimonas aurantiaca]|nr:hypothetical protein [Gemmatimonas aurantiaca]